MRGPAAATKKHAAPAFGSQKCSCTDGRCYPAGVQTARAGVQLCSCSTCFLGNMCFGDHHTTMR